ncbi:hypothetical protein R5R35_009143 [Gryllus longicercus]|uniref:Uncharacterized protein n=1 Tax=Gryllus longicercus TaxID=2509291 RepID=A0AAN9VUU0_9ORTH
MAHLGFLLKVVLLSCGFPTVIGGTVEFLSFVNCSYKGWSCIHQPNNFVDLLYQCFEDTSWHVVIGETPLNLPQKMKSLTIQNCKNVQLSFTFNFTTDGSISTTLALKNIVNVTLLPSLEEVILPRRLILEHICLIKSIRSYSFSKIWGSIVLHNITIDHLETDSFIHLVIEESMKWDNVRIKVLDTNALNDIGASEFTISNSYIGIFELLSFQVRSKKVIIENSRIDDIRFNAIIVLADVFHLVNNTGFNVVMPNAFNILAREVIINENNFTYLQTEALERIGPTLMEEDLGDKVIYSFQNNYIGIADIGSLHVSLLDYIQSGAVMLIGNNTFSCSCTHLGWLGLPAPRDHHFKELYEFHERLLSSEENNTCSGVPCFLPISILRDLVKVQTVCAVNLTGAELCAMFPPATSTPGIASSSELSPSRILTVLVSTCIFCWLV